MYWLRSLIGLVVLTQIVACQSTQQVVVDEKPRLEPFPELDNSPFDLQSVPTKSELFTLNEAQKEHFLNYYFAEENRDILSHKRLSNYLGAKLDQFNFLGKTYTANQTLTEDSGNCLSLAILTTALANVVGLETHYQRVHSAPIYHRHNNILKTSGHVRAVVYANEDIDHEEDVLILRRRAVIIDYFPDINDVGSEFVSEQDFVSMFYQNLAGDALFDENYDAAFSYLQEALKHNQYNPYTLNTLAVLNNQVGYEQNAEKLFEFAVNNTNRTVNLISNYANFLESQGKTAKATSLLTEVESNNDTNPYDWLDLANQHLNNDNNRLALKYYEKALEFGPYLHEVHFGLAQLYWKQGQVNKALASLEKAQSLTFEDPTKRLYIAKSLTLRESVEY
jgi:Tfp pilus assembly protein PilF